MAKIKGDAALDVDVVGSALGCDFCDSAWASFDSLVAHVGAEHRAELTTADDPYGDLDDIKAALAA